ncbi:MAG: bifunctional oligoribonuclease/PAP phosphatase NrnA [Candidatus Omnitrophica bacterium]|nr:bifunctional oligoribonuclease/PAP phosphatase NrnA [Candidatus Omnitrophota bacterium]
MKKIIPILKHGNNFVISAHLNPDPDALCSQTALALYLADLGKNVSIINEDEMSPRYKFLPQVRKIRTMKQAKNVACDYLIVVDSGDIDRIGTVKNFIKKGVKVINIDHHVTNTRFGDLNWVDEKASSASEMIYELLRQARAKISYDQAVLLYTGIMTDTGSFAFDNTSHRTHEISGELLDYGFSANEIYRHIYETTPLADMKLFSKVLTKFDLYENDQVVFISLPKRVMDQFSGEFDVRDRVFDFFRSIKEIEGVIIFSEVSRKLTRVNFRSKVKLNVAKLAALFGGGGHRRASGCQINNNISQARALVLKQIAKVL